VHLCNDSTGNHFYFLLFPIKIPWQFQLISAICLKASDFQHERSRIMPGIKRTRGRPKGSGIDDSRTLLEIGRLIESTPNLRPTTAIRRLGIQDPSTIRRLRDKYNASKDAIHAELIGLPGPRPLNDNISFRLPTEAARQALLKTNESIRRSPKEVIGRPNNRSRQRRNELSCLLAIGAHALAQAAARCQDAFDDEMPMDSADNSQEFLAQMLFMMTRTTGGDETTAS
jgi:hypothetical protein